MTALLLLLVLCILLGPAFMLLPSRRERQQAAFRKRAIARQMRVQLIRLPNLEPEIDFVGRPVSRSRSAIAYRLVRPRPSDWRRRQPPEWKVVRREEAAEEGLPDGWAWQNTAASERRAALLALLVPGLGKMADDVVSLEEGGYEVSVCWQEKEEQSMEAILTLLPQLVALSLPQPEPTPADRTGAGSGGARHSAV